MTFFFLTPVQAQPRVRMPNPISAPRDRAHTGLSRAAAVSPPPPPPRSPDIVFGDNLYVDADKDEDSRRPVGEVQMLPLPE